MTRRRPPVDAIQKETAESLLRKLIELNDPRYIPGRLYPRRHARTQAPAQGQGADSSRDGQRVFIYEQPGTGDVFTIIDPALQLNQLEQVQRDVAALLEHGLNPPAPSPQPAAAGSRSRRVAADAPAPDGRTRSRRSNPKRPAIA